MRSTEDKLLHIPLNVGMNQAVSPRLAPTGTLYSVQNCRISGNGILEKRPGTTALDGSSSGGNSHKLQGDGTNSNVELPSFACQVQSSLTVGTTYGDAFCLDSSSSLKWQFQGRFSTCLPVRKRYGLAVDDVLVSGEGFGQTPPDILVTSSGYVCVAGLTRGGKLHFYVEDQSGVRIFYIQQNSAYSRVRLVSQLDVVQICVQNGAEIDAFQVTIAGGLVTTALPTIVGTMSSASASWDVTAYTSSAWYVAFQSGAATMTLQKMNGGTSSSTATFAITGLPPVTLWADTTNHQLWVGFYDDPLVTGNVKYSVWDITSTITVVKAATLLKTGLFLGPPMFGRYRGVLTNTTKKAFYCFAQFSISATTAATWVGSAFGSATAPTTPVACWHVIPISKPDNYNRVWCMVQSFSDNQILTRSILLRFPDELLVAPPTTELSGPNMPSLATTFSPFTSNMWFSGNGISSTRSYAVLPNILQQFYGAQAIVKFDVYEYTTAEQEPHKQNTRFGVTTIIAGQPVEFFGQSVATVNTPSSGGVDAPALAAGASEIGFPHAPIVFSVTPSNSGVGFLAVGTRSWRVTYEWIDMYGRRHQSAPSKPVSSTSDASHVSATLVIGTTDITQRQAANTGLRVFLRIYRTVAGGTEYHECAATAVAFAQSSGGLITFVDSESDANIAQDGFIYTDGGVLDDTLAPSCRFTCKSEDRVWFGGLWDANIVQCSKVIVPGEPIQCTDDFSHQVQLPAPCTALAYMDGNVVAFTADAIYLIGGDGPNDQGSGLFSPPRALTRSIGCIDYRSVVETNVGVMFQANLGIYLLPRGFGPAQYIGAAVQDEMNDVSDLGPVVLGAISHITRDDHLARFLIAPGNATPPTSGSTVLTYDIDGGQWFKDTLPVATAELGAFDSLMQSGFKGAVFVRGDLSTVTSSTPVYIESTVALNDLSGSFNVSQYVKTAWIHPFGLGGYGKVNCVMVAVEGLGDQQTFSVTVQTDSNATQFGSWLADAPGGLNVVSYFMIVISDNRACTAVQIQMQGDFTPLRSGGFKFISCTLEVEPTGGIRLLSDAEKR